MARKKTKKTQVDPSRRFEEPEELKKAPHTFVLKKGKVDKDVTQLMLDTRQIMEPFTASNLKTQKLNVTRDFVGVASLLHVTHMLMFTETEQGAYLRLCRLPKGPTITFKIGDFMLSRDVKSIQRRPVSTGGFFQHSPLLVMNGFSEEEDANQELKLTSSMWRHLFPSIDINSVNLNDIRRTVLLNFNPETKEIDFRHYAVKVKPVGLSRPVRKLLTSRKFPDFGKFKDMSEALGASNDGNITTESEGEADDRDESRQVVISHEMKSRANLVDEKSAVRLVELGPRLTLSLIKIEEGLMEGAVLYHSIVKKSKEEIAELNEKIVKSRRLKNLRKEEQAKNVEKKQSELEKKSNRKTRKLEQLKQEQLAKAESKGKGKKRRLDSVQSDPPSGQVTGKPLKGILKKKTNRIPLLKKRRKEMMDQ